MLLTVKDAATRMGCSPRAVRAALKAGRIQGYKRGGQWVVPRRNLPLTETQVQATALTIDDLHDAVDEAVPAQVKAQLGGPGVASLRAFDHTRQVLAALEAVEAEPPVIEPLTAALREGLRAIAEGHHQYAPAVTIEASRACPQPPALRPARPRSPISASLGA